MEQITRITKENIRDMAWNLHNVSLTDEESALVQSRLEELWKDLEAMKALADQWSQFEPATTYDLTKEVTIWQTPIWS